MPANVVIAAAGSVDHDAIVELAPEHAVDARTGRRRRAAAAPAPPTRPRRGVRFERKDTEQFHVCLGGPALPRHDERRFALRVLDAIFGGTSSSRLFQEVREHRGLAYAVYSFTSAYQDTGQVGLYVGTRPDNLARGAGGRRAPSSTACASEPATDEELARARRTSRGASCSRWSRPARA